MKKILLLFFTFLSFATYDTECEIEGEGEVSSISVSFNDQGDCNSNDYTAVYVYVDNSTETVISTPENPTYDGGIDFGNFDCCDEPPT